MPPPPELLPMPKLLALAELLRLLGAGECNSFMLPLLWNLNNNNDEDDDDDGNNSIQFYIINVPSQHLQRQLQTQHNVDIGSKIKSKAT
jgi:hypothetical protein